MTSQNEVLTAGFLICGTGLYVTTYHGDAIDAYLKSVEPDTYKLIACASVILWHIVIAYREGLAAMFHLDASIGFSVAFIALLFNLLYRIGR